MLGCLTISRHKTMISGRVGVITSYLKRYDKDLYADRTRDGRINIFRKYRSYDYYRMGETNLYVSTIRPQFVCGLTLDWSETGTPVEWGIEPILTKIKRMDQWRENILKQIHDRNDQIDRDNKRQKTNEIRARAADCRKEFARATNEYTIGSATVDKEKHKKRRDRRN